MLHPPLMALFLSVFTIMGIAGFVRSIRSGAAFPAVMMLFTALIMGYSAIITGLQ